MNPRGPNLMSAPSTWPARLIAIGGLSGTGKSTLATSIAALMAPAGKILLLRSDVERKARFGVAETARLDAIAYTPQVTRRIYARLAAKAGAALANQTVVIVDAVFSRPDERALVEQVARDCATRFQGLWLEAATRTMRDRVAARLGDASDATPEIVDRQSAYDPGFIDWHRIDAGGTAAATFANARHVLGL